jgi:hypothetical protein
MFSVDEMALLVGGISPGVVCSGVFFEGFHGALTPLIFGGGVRTTGSTHTNQGFKSQTPSQSL